MNPDLIDHIFFKIEETPKMSERLKSYDKGYIIGTVGKVNNDLSITSNPMVHKSSSAAINEATRLLNSGSISKERRAVVLKIENYLELRTDPVILT